jgi:hypothetical protein
MMFQYEVKQIIKDFKIGNYFINERKRKEIPFVHGRYNWRVP